MRNLILLALTDAGHPYLQGLLANTPENQHTNVENQFNDHLNSLAEFCMNGYKSTGLLTTSFIRGLHRTMFPDGYIITTVTPEGTEFKTLPGEYRLFQSGHPSYLNPGRTTSFLIPDQIATGMDLAVNNVNTKLLAATDRLQILDAIFMFLIDFLALHPFANANGRVACVLADLLAIHCGLQPLYFQRIKTNDKIALYQAIESVMTTHDFTLAREMFLRYEKMEQVEQ